MVRGQLLFQKFLLSFLPMENHWEVLRTDVSDIPLNGRALMLPGMQVPLVGEITINLTDDIKDIYEAIVVGESLDYRVVGQYTIETAWQVLDVQFDSSI